MKLKRVGLLPIFLHRKNHTYGIFEYKHCRGGGKKRFYKIVRIKYGQGWLKLYDFAPHILNDDAGLYDYVQTPNNDVLASLLESKAIRWERKTPNE